MKFIDTHAHIYSKKFDGDREKIIRETQDEGVEKIYMPNISVESIDDMLELERIFPEVCIPMMGLHPCDVLPNFQKDLYVMEEWISKRDFAGIGETGIDLYWDKTYLNEQKESLKIHAEWAKEKGWPLILHCRDSMDETLEVIESLQDERLFGIFHCFSGSLEQAKKIIELGFYLGIGGTVTYKNSSLKALLPQIGPSRLVLETDSPYLAPVPHRGKRNAPSNIPLIGKEIAAILDISLAEVAAVTTENAKKIFNPAKDEL
ncbi:TatD family hydrolase [Lunatibacter salilacus]|uniref:TatD family hydrolase n=1 Tax=Lunatibacter salilacus TaxID=2483804 RepID=UPI00131B0323|nr:TatD family hydrolase [Lunatibacter salilacus]